ncbi:helix-turn-helix domain-containing protein [Mesorhizobium sp. M0847]|uniref:helix-turn-helix domain-containing protein n=1 Tax=unclassified Mesorhizobium TaxID=325217 RepID=UPI003339DF95
MTDPLDILANHLQGLADQVAAALQAARAMQAERNESVDFQPLTRQPDIRSDDLIEPSAAASRFHIAKDTVRLWCRQNKVFCVKDGGRWLVSASSIRAKRRAG